MSRLLHRRLSAHDCFLLSICLEAYETTLSALLHERQWRQEVVDAQVRDIPGGVGQGEASEV
jgi:hypothetical protein